MHLSGRRLSTGSGESSQRALEEKMDEELEQYLGRAKHERRKGGTRRIIERVLSSSPINGDRRSHSSDSTEPEEICIEGIRGL